MFTNTTVTLYNAYFDTINRNTIYKRTVLTSVHWEGIEARSRGGNYVENADSVKVSIPFSVSSDSIFVKPKAFKNLEDKTGYFTLKSDDKIVKGTIPDSVDFKDLEENYDDVVSITSVDTAYYGSSHMQHWELNCK